MSFPPGTEMFQFPGFASPHYVFMRRYPIGVGCPIRISTDQRLLAAPRGFSQRATSFIASWCQGIHRMPLFHSKSRRHAQEQALPVASTRTRQQNHPIQTATFRSHTPLNAVARRKGQTCDQARPETHQNQIHLDKEQHAPNRERTCRMAAAAQQFQTFPAIFHGDGRTRTDDPLLAKQVLSQLSYAPSRHPVVGQGGFEPPTPRLSSVCSNQLSY